MATFIPCFLVVPLSFWYHHHLSQCGGWQSCLAVLLQWGIFQFSCYFIWAPLGPGWEQNLAIKTWYIRLTGNGLEMGKIYLKDFFPEICLSGNRQRCGIHPNNYAHDLYFAMFSSVWHRWILSISLRVASLALEQWNSRNDTNNSESYWEIDYMNPPDKCICK